MWSATHCHSSGLRWRSRLASISLRRQPQRAHDAVVQRAPRFGVADRPAQSEAQVAHVLASTGTVQPRQVHANQRLGLEAAGRFFQGLAHHALQQRFAWLQMPGRVV